MRDYYKRAGGVFMILLFSFIFQACHVYHNTASSLDEGIRTSDRVRVVTRDNVFYEFKSLQREKTQLYGIAGRGSDTAKMLIDRENITDGNNVKIPLLEEEITAVYLKNRKMSKWINYGVPVIGAAGIFGLTSPNFRPDVGN
jgi:hypothetical protein